MKPATTTLYDRIAQLRDLEEALREQCDSSDNEPPLVKQLLEVRAERVQAESQLPAYVKQAAP